MKESSYVDMFLQYQMRWDTVEVLLDLSVDPVKLEKTSYHLYKSYKVDCSIWLFRGGGQGEMGAGILSLEVFLPYTALTNFLIL